MARGVKDNLIGNKYGRLLVLEKAENRGNCVMWLCECDCGKAKEVRGSMLKSGFTKSCGCLQAEYRYTHGETGTRLYRVWYNMKSRCYNKKTDRYMDYGGRGITVCSSWHKYEPFRDWALKNGYSDELTLDREDNDKGYSPDNCRWVTYAEQNSNKRKYKSNKSGHTGVLRDHRKWKAYIGIDGEKIVLGYYDDIEDAIAARKKAETEKAGRQINFGDLKYKEYSRHYYIKEDLRVEMEK